MCVRPVPALAAHPAPEQVVMCMRRKAAQYIRKYASAKQRGGIPLQDELLLAEGYRAGACSDPLPLLLQACQRLRGCPCCNLRARVRPRGGVSRLRRPGLDLTSPLTRNHTPLR